MASQTKIQSLYAALQRLYQLWKNWGTATGIKPSAGKETLMA
jgi:hypothetical protein